MASGAIKSAIRGKRGQAFLRELADALDAMPVKQLAFGALADDGCHCALGVLGEKRGLDLRALQPEDLFDEWDQDAIARAFGVAKMLALEVQWINDDGADHMDDDDDRARNRRWRLVRDWVRRNIRESEPA